MMNRRDFVQACTVILGSSVLPVGCGDSGGDDPMQNDVSTLPDLSKSKWIDIPSTAFSVTHETYGVVDMTLTDIEDELLIPEAEQFSITLTGPELPVLDEDNYQVYNESLGYVVLYLQPGASPAGVQNYRAVFSLLDS